MPDAALFFVAISTTSARGLLELALKSPSAKLEYSCPEQRHVQGSIPRRASNVEQTYNERGVPPRQSFEGKYVVAVSLLWCGARADGGAYDMPTRGNLTR